MSFALIIFVIVAFALFGGAALTGLMVARMAARPSLEPSDSRLLEQAERIATLEDELSRLREQADFTERLLTERGEPGEHDGT